MLAACKAALSGRGPSAVRGGAPSPPSDKQVEAFARAITEAQLDQVAAHVAESKSLLVSPLKCHPARSSAWHLAAAISTRGPNSKAELLELLLRLYREQELPPEGLVELLNASNKRGQTCLHAAAAGGNAGAMRLLLANGAELLRADKSCRTAMHHAASAGNEECVQLLLAAAEAEDARAIGAAPPRPGNAGPRRAPSTASMDVDAVPPSPASQPSSPPQQAAGGTMVSRLVNCTDVSGLTPLHFAAAVNAQAMTRMLLVAGASYTAQAVSDNLEASMPCNAGWTCLHVAAMRGHYDVAMTVLRYHISRSAEQQVADWRPGRSNRTSDPRAVPDRRGTTACSLAQARSFQDLAALLNPDAPLVQMVQGTAPVGPDGQEVRPQSMFVCPITQEVMRDPVVASDGFTYERAAITKWIATGKQTSPMTNLPFSSRTLYPNNVVKSAIKEWRQQHQLPDPDAQQRQGRRMVVPGLVVDANNAVGGGSGDPFLSHLRAHGL